ncbi:MAG: PUR family DNA/RNA-binding protein [Bacteroidales bacterium]|nr:PUR family DNA/RNA-binding protein [Bacteroidales bacterium]
MENRKEELYSQAIPAGKRRYFFDVKETRGGDKFVTITESRRIFDNNTGEFYYDKNKIFLYKEDFEKFQKGLANAFSFIETGIEPEPVVVENDYHEYKDDRHDFGRDGLEEIEFKF